VQDDSDVSAPCGDLSEHAAPVLAGVSVQPSLAQPPVDGTVALTGARVIDGTGAAPIEQATTSSRTARK
jgi:hypothetical protein